MSGDHRRPVRNVVGERNGIPLGLWWAPLASPLSPHHPRHAFGSWGDSSDECKVLASSLDEPAYSVIGAGLGVSAFVSGGTYSVRLSAAMEACIWLVRVAVASSSQLVVVY